MAILAISELADGRRALLLAVDAEDREKLENSRGVWTDLRVEDATALAVGVSAVAVIPCEQSDFLDLLLRLESSTLTMEARKARS